MGGSTSSLHDVVRSGSYEEIEAALAKVDKTGKRLLALEVPPYNLKDRKSPLMVAAEVGRSSVVKREIMFGDGACVRLVITLAAAQLFWRQRAPAAPPSSLRC